MCPLWCFLLWNAFLTLPSPHVTTCVEIHLWCTLGSLPWFPLCRIRIHLFSALLASNNHYYTNQLFDSFFDSCPHHILSICGQDLVLPSAVPPHTPRAHSVTLRFELKWIPLKKSVKESPGAISDADRSVVGFLFLETENEPNVNDFPGECLGVNFEQRRRI